MDICNLGNYQKLVMWAYKCGGPIPLLATISAVSLVSGITIGAVVTKLCNRKLHDRLSCQIVIVDSGLYNKELEIEQVKEGV